MWRIGCLGLSCTNWGGGGHPVLYTWLQAAAWFMRRLHYGFRGQLRPQKSSQSPVAAWTSDIDMASGSSRDHGHPQGLWQQHKSWTSISMTSGSSAHHGGLSRRLSPHFRYLVQSRHGWGRTCRGVGCCTQVAAAGWQW